MTYLIIGPEPEIVYHISLPSAEQVFFAMLLTALWYVSVRALSMLDIDDFVEKQLREFDANLMVVGFCAIIALPITTYFMPMFLSVTIQLEIAAGYLTEAIWGTWQFQLIPVLLNWLWVVIAALWVWVALNIVHCMCIIIDERTEKKMGWL